MIIGVGVDIVTHARVKDAIDTAGNAFLDAVYTPWEQVSAASQPNSVAYYSMLFAAKEAVFKAFATRWAEGVKLSEVEIRAGQNGEPLPRLHGRFAELAAELGGAEAHVSVSYDGGCAIAAATLSVER